MGNDVLDTLTFATGLPADSLEPYRVVGQRLDEQLIRSLASGSLSLRACLTLTRVPPHGQREIVGRITRENLELTEHEIAERIRLCHRELHEANPLEYLNWLHWMIEALRETPLSPEEAAALHPAVGELTRTLEQLKRKLEEERRRASSEGSS
jgi:hypothetical protein